MTIKFGSVLLGSLMFVTGCGSTLPLVFVDKTSVGLEVSGPNPSEGSSGNILLGFKTRSAAVVPIAVKNESERSVLDPTEKVKLQQELADVRSTITTLESRGTTKSEELNKAKTEEEQIKRILYSAKSYDRIVSTKNGDEDALSVLGQFQVDASAGSDQSGVGLGRFFATGSAASRLADGFAAKLGSKKVPLKANDDTYEIESGKVLSGISVHANDLFDMHEKTVISVPAKNGEAVLDIKTGNLTYTPGDKAETDIFSYALTDQMGHTSSALVKIKIIQPAPKPVSSIVPAAETKEFEIAKNSKGEDFDLLDPLVVKDALNVEITDKPQKGEASITGGKALKYIPNENQTGLDQLTYKITDKDGQNSSEATVKITIK